MIYAIATHSFLVAVELDTNWHLQNYEVLNTGYHYGIAVIEGDHGDLLLKEKDRQLIVYRGGKSVSEQNDPQLMIYHQSDNFFEFVGSMSFVRELGDVHQIAYANDGVYIANTKYNTLVFRGLGNDKCHEYVFENVRYDRNHVNSVYPCGDQIFALLHNRRHKESEIVLLQHNLSGGFALKQRLSLWHENCHNVFFETKYLLYNASLAKKLVVVDMERERVSKRLSFAGLDKDMPPNAGHVKGISVIKDYLVVGVSEHTSRDKRPTSMGYLAVVDRCSLSTLAIIDLNFPDLPHPIGNINEVRCISGGELAQSRSARSNVDWASMRLAKNSPLSYYLRRLKGKLLTPALQMKRCLTK